MRSPQNVLKSLNSRACSSNYRYQRLYRNLYDPELYLMTYQKIQIKQGNMTTGTDGKTVDGIGMKHINVLITGLKDFSYQSAPARRTYIPKANSKKRPLGIPSFDDKLVQEAVRMILENIYEPTFLNASHGFRPKRSCHAAFQHIQKSFTGVKWFVEGDIKGCFDHVDHHALVNVLRRRIQDEHFIGLIWKFLKAGYIENWVYHNTYSGTPQGSIIGPILANIYLDKLDVFMAQHAQTFRQGNKRRINPAYKKPLDKRHGKQEWLKRNESKIFLGQKAAVMAEVNKINQYLCTIPYVDPMDDSYKWLVYVHYADDSLIGVIGSKTDARQVKTDVGVFIREQLHLGLSQEKTLITHGINLVRFLSFQITTSKEQNSTHTKAGYVRRPYTGRVKLYVPKERWLKRLLSYGALKIHYDRNSGNKEIWEPVCRPSLRNLGGLEILSQYNTEIRGSYSYYRIAHNATVLNNLLHVVKYSIYKTFAGKYRTSIQKITQKYIKEKDFVVAYQNKSDEKSVVFYNQGVYRDTHVDATNPGIIGWTSENRSYTSFVQRLEGGQCEWCGTTDVEIEIHHIRELKDLSGKTEWERHMIARRCKTMALCHNCHVKLYAGKLDRYLESRTHREVYIRFGGERLEACRRNAARRWALTLLYAALAPILLSTFVGEPSQNVGKSLLKSYATVYPEGAVIVLVCIIFSVPASSPPVVDLDAAVASMVWSYIGEVTFNMLILVGSVKMSGHMVREMMGL